MVGMAEMGTPISLDGVAVHPDCWCACLCYLHFAPKNPEDGEMYLLVPAQPGCPVQSPESSKMVVCVTALATEPLLLCYNVVIDMPKWDICSLSARKKDTKTHFSKSSR